VDPPRLSVVSRTKVILLQLALFVVAGLVLGGGFVVVKTMLDRSLRYPDEVPEVLDLPVLAVLPYDPAHVAPRGGPSTSTKRTAPGARPTDLRRLG
jgi:hypothetical protein